MIDKEPTQEQRREFWKQCGFEEVEYLNTSGESCASHFVSPDGTWGKAWFPEINLNNLFKYAVPKLGEVRLAKSDHHLDYVAVVVDYVNEKGAKRLNPNPALSLFWAIWDCSRMLRV